MPIMALRMPSLRIASDSACTPIVTPGTSTK
jgi:hypothetical protein